MLLNWLHYNKRFLSAWVLSSCLRNLVCAALCFSPFTHYGWQAFPSNNSSFYCWCEEQCSDTEAHCAGSRSAAFLCWYRLNILLPANAHVTHMLTHAYYVNSRAHMCRITWLADFPFAAFFICILMCHCLLCKAEHICTVSIGLIVLLMHMPLLFHFSLC